MHRTTRLLIPLAALFGFVVLGASPAKAQRFSGTYGHPDRTSLRIVTQGETVHLTFYRSNKTVSSKGVGLIIGGKLYFFFKRRASTGKRGGSGVYVLKGRNIRGTHFHLDGKVRWKGTWRRRR